MATEYEWVVEEMDGEDIGDVHCFESFLDAKAALEEGCVLALRKLKSNRACDSVDSFSYAYLNNGKLPFEFDDKSKVPVRFLAESTN
jgi:hypothetical protein